MEIFGFTKPACHPIKLPEEDSFAFKEVDGTVVAAVADGITRDPIGVKFLPPRAALAARRRAFANYPNPSPAKIAADIFCRSFSQFLSAHYSTAKYSSGKIIKDAFQSANEKIAEYNRQTFPRIDYLENDFAACVAVGGIINDKRLFYGFIGDCGVAVFDKTGRLKFRTPDEVEPVQKFLMSENKSFSDPARRVEIRSQFRNNPKHRVNGKKLSFGALTGEPVASQYFRFGDINLVAGDRVLFYSDGITEIIFDKNFGDWLTKNNLSELKNYTLKNSSPTQNPSEGTLIALDVD